MQSIMNNRYYSKRRYPKRKCKNPACNVEPDFAPHDKRQEYCCVQCRTDAGNDRRGIANRTIFANEKLLRDSDKKLAKLYAKFLSNGHAIVHISYLEYEGVDVLLLVKKQKNLATGLQIHWFYEYGLEINIDNPDYFVIHKKLKHG